MTTAIQIPPVTASGPLTIDGHFGPDRGALESQFDVTVAGTVQDGAAIKTSATVIVKGAVEAANIQAAQLHITGGLLGKSSGQILATGKVTGKFCAFANIQTQGNVEFETEIAQTTILTRGAVKIPRGIITGGRIVANGGGECRVLGNPNGAATDIGVGFDDLYDESATRELAKLDAIMKHVAHVRTKVEPLMKQQKLLSPAQKEKAIELLYEASESETRAKESASVMRKAIDEIDALANPELIIHETLHANVTIRFRGAHAVTKADMIGPIKLTLTRSHQFTSICVTEIGTGKSCFLDTVTNIDPTVAVRATLSQMA